MRRDSNDKKWKKCKDKVYKRDKGICQICRCLTAYEVNQTKKLSSLPHLFLQIDPAHILPVSVYPEIMYDENNILSLCRHHHTLIDDYQDVVSGEHIQENKVFYWWWRAKFQETSQYDESIDYKNLLYTYHKKQKSSFEDFLNEKSNEDFDPNKYL